MSAETDAISTDQELLEMYLDGELDAAGAAAFVRRLGVDASLAAALADAQRQRELRAQVWQALEPDGQHTDQLIWRIRGAAAERRHEPPAAETAPAAAPMRIVATAASRRGWSTWSVARWPAAAACILFGFAIGRLGRGDGNALSPAGQAPLAVNGGPSATPMVGFPTGFAPGQFVAYPYSAEDPRRFDDDFASHASAPTGFNDDRVKLTSDEKVDQKF